MTIKERNEALRSEDQDQSEDQDLLHEAITMALAILVERIRRLPQADRDDLYELMKELPNADTCEERNAIAVTMREILDQAPARLKKGDQDDTTKPVPRLQRWIDYVSEKIREIRQRQGLTQIELAERSGLPQSHISRLESGKHSPSRVTLEKIAAGLGVPLHDLDPSD